MRSSLIPDDEIAAIRSAIENLKVDADRIYAPLPKVKIQHARELVLKLARSAGQEVASEGEVESEDMCEVRKEFDRVLEYLFLDIFGQPLRPS